MNRFILSALALLCATAYAHSDHSKAVPVTPDNFNRAETDTTYAVGVKSHGLGVFEHHRQPISIDFHLSSTSTSWGARRRPTTFLWAGPGP